MRLPISSMILAACLSLTGCSSEEDAPITGDEAALTQARIPKHGNASLERLRAHYEAAAKTEATAAKDGAFFGYAAAFKWSSTHSLANGLSAEQKSFLATELISHVRDVPDRIPYGADLRAVDVDSGTGLASKDLRLAEGAASEVDADLAAAIRDKQLVVRIEPATLAPGATRTAGALMVVDLEKREALILYGRRGATPFRVECTVTKMVSYEFEEALSKEEYPSVDAAEIPLFGDLHLDVGANGTLSNANAKSEGEDYSVVLTRNGTAVEMVAKGQSFFHAKLVVDGASGVIYGDRDGNGRANKAAELACKTH